MADASLRASGIYAIRNTVNGKHYVGSSISVRRRLAEHRREMADGSHKNIRLCAAWRKYGPSAFEFSVVEIGVARDELIAREQFWMDKLLSCGRTGYNILPCAGSRAGSIATPETRSKLSVAGLGRTHSDETRKKLSQLLTGKVRTAEMLANVRAAAIASTARKTAEQRSEAARKGAATRRDKLASMTPEELSVELAKRSAASKRSMATARERGYTVSQQTKDRQMAARIARGAAERRAIALRAWETKRAKQLVRGDKC